MHISKAQIVPVFLRFLMTFFFAKRDILFKKASCCREIVSILSLHLPSCRRWRLAREAVQANGLAVKECPWKNVFVLSSLIKASCISCVQAVTPKAIVPPVNALLRQ